MVQTGMTTPYTAFAQQNGGPGAGDTTSLKPDMKAVEGGPPGGAEVGVHPTVSHNKPYRLYSQLNTQQQTELWISNRMQR